MASQRVITQAVDRAIETATVNASAPEKEHCRFDPDALADVTRLCSSGHGRAAVVEVAQHALQRWIDGLDRVRTLAAVALLTRLESGTERRVIPVENLQGDVGTGSGQAPC